jgi:hypothetical protein
MEIFVCGRGCMRRLRGRAEIWTHSETGCFSATLKILQMFKEIDCSPTSCLWRTSLNGVKCRLPFMGQSVHAAVKLPTLMFGTSHCHIAVAITRNWVREKWQWLHSRQVSVHDSLLEHDCHNMTWWKTWLIKANTLHQITHRNNVIGIFS